MKGPRILWLTAVAAVTVAAAFGAALVAWPRVSLAAADQALARVELPSFAGRVVRLDASGPAGALPVRLADGAVWPQRRLAPGARITLDVTVRRPSWIGWLVGGTEHRQLVLRAPVARPLRRWLVVANGRHVQVAFDAPVARVRVGGGAGRLLASPTAVVDTGIVRAAGSVAIAAAARPWETLAAPVTVHWFPRSPLPQVLARPRSGAALAPGRALTLSFSAPVARVLGDRLPRLTPATPGRWERPDAHTLRFVPSGLGYALGRTVRVTLPEPDAVAGGAALRWQVPLGSTLRLQQLLARLRYLPLRWSPTGDGGGDPLATPPGTFSWRYANTPPQLRSLWAPGKPNVLTRAAVMAFESDQGLTPDGIAGPDVWQALLHASLAGARHHGGYSWVLVHRSLPQQLELWHNGRVVLRSPVNTGVAAAPTVPGTFPVFEHVPVTTMSGTNPDGSHYNDPGVRWVSYFNGGDALHYFPRASYGTPQSVGCVEMPLAQAAAVYPYTPIGTLVTVS